MEMILIYYSAAIILSVLTFAFFKILMWWAYRQERFGEDSSKWVFHRNIFTGRLCGLGDIEEYMIYCYGTLAVIWIITLMLYPFVLALSENQLTN